jgi:glycosyltransferase involved in cell wall biosynthesis
MNPILTVVCLCYNQGRYLEQAITSVFSQQEVSFEVIIVDDCSTDDSQLLIGLLANKYKFDEVILHKKNVGNCKSFNEALKLARGKYIIDLAADDYFHKGAFHKQMKFFEQESLNVGMIFSNALIVDEEGGYINHHFQLDSLDNSIDKIPSGAVFADVLDRYFICVPTMVMRKSWLLELGGYNEELSYEDFDLWVRGSLISEFIYLDEVLISKRIHSGQLSSKMLSTLGSDYYLSTLRVCEYASLQVTTVMQQKALTKRIKYEGRNASFFQVQKAMRGFKELLKSQKEWRAWIAVKWFFICWGGKIFFFLKCR